MLRNIDEVDVQLLKALQENARITNADLARLVGLSGPSVLQRVRALEKAGLIRGYHAILDHDRLGMRVTAYVMISLSLHQEMPIERFRKGIQDIPEIMECYHVSGEYDFMLKVIVKDMRAYEVFLRERLSKIRGIGKINTNFVLATNKLTTKVPI